MNQVMIVTLPFCDSLGGFDTSKLDELQACYHVIQHNSYMIRAMDDPHLVLILTCRSKQNVKKHSSVSEVVNGSNEKDNSSSNRRQRARELEALLAMLSEEECQKFEALRVWRNELAISEGIPSFEICSNKQLYYLMTNPPKSVEDLKQHQGFGKKRITRFGKVLVDYFKDNT